MSHDDGGPVGQFSGGAEQRGPFPSGGLRRHRRLLDLIVRKWLETTRGDSSAVLPVPLPTVDRVLVVLGRKRRVERRVLARLKRITDTPLVISEWYPHGVLARRGPGA